MKTKRLLINFEDKYKNMLTEFMVEAEVYEALLMKKDIYYMILVGALA